jgi:hypothetical protein
LWRTPVKGLGFFYQVDGRHHDTTRGAIQPEEENPVKVKDLLAILSTLNPDSDIVLGTQQNYPMEATLYGVAVHSDFADVDEDDDAPPDVVLLEGSHLRYGSRDAWSVARTG